jgi:hypothetical protein
MLCGAHHDHLKSSRWLVKVVADLSLDLPSLCGMVPQVLILVTHPIVFICVYMYSVNLS